MRAWTRSAGDAALRAWVSSRLPPVPLHTCTQDLAQGGGGRQAGSPAGSVFTRAKERVMGQPHPPAGGPRAGRPGAPPGLRLSLKLAPSVFQVLGPGGCDRPLPSPPSL